MVEVSVDDRGRILVPKDLRDKLGIRGGERLSVDERDGEVVLRPVESKESLKELKGVVEDSEVSPDEVKDIWSE